MNMRRPLVIVITIVALISSFYLGAFREKMKESLRQEESYAWDLHRKIKDAALTCEKLLAGSANSPFYMESLDAGKALLVANYNKENHTVAVTILDPTHRALTDSWEMECK